MGNQNLEIRGKVPPAGDSSRVNTTERGKGNKTLTPMFEEKVRTVEGGKDLEMDVRYP